MYSLGRVTAILPGTHRIDTAGSVNSFSWIVSQVTAREHYAVPRSMHLNGRLSTFYTDAWCRYGASLLRHAPRRLRALAGRYHRDLPSHKVVAFTAATLADEVRGRSHRGASTLESVYGAYLAAGERFCNRVNRHLLSSTRDPRREAFFGFDTGCLETLHALAPRGFTCVVDQIDAARVEQRLVTEEISAWPGWQQTPAAIPDAYFQRLSAEWALASIVLVNSDWSRRALVEQGVPERKIIVVPLAYEPPAAAISPRVPHERPLVVLWLGTLALGKGIQYLFEASRLLQDRGVRFIVAGGAAISAEALATAPPNVTLLGRVTRDRTTALFGAADVFVIPTLSDGFAVTQLEAMAHGLPVIATRHCGDVVTDGEDGYLVPIRDGSAIASAVARLDDDRRLLADMSGRAVIKASSFTLQRYYQTLASEVATRMERH